MAMAELRIIPSEAYPNALSALRSMIHQAKTLRAAVAFVTKTGVDEIAEIVGSSPELKIELVARGAPITDPQELLRLSDIGVKVRIVIGSRALAFHPKLWIARTENSLKVLSGSGNLTSGGLDSNAEQFEFIHLSEPTDYELIELNEARWKVFRDLSISLGSLQGMPYWDEWNQQARERSRLSGEVGELDQRLLGMAGNADQLYLDLVGLYDKTRSRVKTTRSDGVEIPYTPNRFKRKIDRANAENRLVPAVAEIVKDETPGFDRLLEANEPELCVEYLVLDRSKPYHGLFEPGTIAAAERRMEKFAGRWGVSD